MRKRVIHKFRPMAPDRRPQDRAGDGRGLTFETLEHYGECPDQMPQAIRARDPNGRTAVYVPIKVGGKVVDSLGFYLSPKPPAPSTKKRPRHPAAVKGPLNE